MDILNITRLANQLEQPFSVYPLATLGHLAVHVFICMGQIDWHRHPDEDELFLVHEGVITLETELGTHALHAEELLVVPKGVAHRSGSRLRSIVLLIRPVVLTHRTNGHRHTAVPGESTELQKQRLANIRRELTEPYQPLTVAGVENYRLRLGVARGVGPGSSVARGSLFLLSLRGSLRVNLPDETGVLHEGEAVVLSKGQNFQLQAEREATYLMVGTREE